MVWLYGTKMDLVESPICFDSLTRWRSESERRERPLLVHTSKLQIFENCAAHFSDFIRLNEQWIETYFEIEEADRKLAADPGAVVSRGGFLFTAKVEGVVAGTSALFREPNGEFELARMAVDPAYRGRGLGRILAEHALAKAWKLNSPRVFLLSNRILEPAITLYRSLGFVEVDDADLSGYSRCDIVMELRPPERRRRVGEAS